MNLKNIKYFTTLAECLNFTQAANQFHITQTAMSRYISSLEAELGVKLFDRSSRTVKLTEAGKLYKEGVDRIMKDYDYLVERMHAAADRFQGHIKVGIGIYEYRNTEKYFTKFLETYPDIKIDVFQYNYSMLSQKLKAGELDMIITLDMSKQDFHSDKITSVDLFTSKNVLVMSREKEEEYQNMTAEQILKKEYLVTNCEDNGPSSMKMLKGLMERDIGFMPENIVQTNSLGAQLLMVKTGHGVAIVPEFLSEIHEESLKIMDLPQKAPQQYCVIMHTDRKNAAADLFFQSFDDGKHRG